MWLSVVQYLVVARIHGHAYANARRHDGARKRSIGEQAEHSFDETSYEYRLDVAIDENAW